ncbi:MAG: LysR family transcriptional regulator [Proteobacteria bacterium]|nr:LysR family transcriptional regulator [Pseudomonadota bacterium]
MEWGDLEVFLAAVRTGSYTAAARQLDVNRTTVGRRVEALERTLGVPLFEQTPLGYAPTQAGARLLAAAEAIEREVAAMTRDIGVLGRRVAPIRIAGSGGLAAAFLPELAAFRRANPDVSVELLGELDPLDAVTQRRADLGLALVRSPPLRLAGVEIGTLDQAVYGRKGLTDLPPLGWGYEFDAALPGGPWVSANPAGEAAQAAGLATCNDWAQLIQAVLAGLGTASLWCFAADAESTLERLSEPDPRHDCPLWLIHRAKAPPGPGLARLIAFLREAIGARIA